jgi:tol-pal system protein YbgF
LTGSPTGARNGTRIDSISRRVLRSRAMTRPLALVAVLVVLATGCATRGAYHRMQAEVATVRSEMTDLRKAQETTARDLARASAESRALEARLSEVSVALKEGNAEVTRLRTRVEAAEAEARAAKAAAPPPPPAPPPTPAPAAVPAPALVVEPPRSVPTRGENPQAVYKAALATFRAGEHGQAVLDFLDFIAKHPRHPLVANAQYWIGEAYYVQRDYRQALTEFQKVLVTAPGSAKAADALLKIGLAHKSLRDHRRARQSWQRVVRDFPRSEAAAKAKVFLK